MKIVKFASLEAAEAEADRLVSVLNLPTLSRGVHAYGKPFQIEGEIWVLKVKENGSYPSAGVIQGTIEEWEKPDPEAG